MKIFFFILIIFILLQFIPIKQENKDVDVSMELKAPDSIIKIFKKSCFDCHSNETKWPWYSSIAPISWSIISNVNTGRQWLNFSIWETYTKKEKAKKLYEIFKAVYIKMPPSEYMFFHKDSILEPNERKAIRDWTNIMSPKNK